MKCDIGVIKNMRDGLVKGASDARVSPGAMSSEGESFELSAKLFDSLAKNVRNPGEVFQALEERKSDLSKPFQIALRRELGEEITLNVDGKPKKYYLLASNFKEDSDSVTGVRINLRLALQDDLSQVSNFVYDTSSDTSLEVLGGTVGTATGISRVLKKAAVKVINQMGMANSIQTAVKDEGDKELGETLTKMKEVDEVLGSRQSRTSDSVQGYEKLTEFVHGDIDSMKMLLGKLHVLGNSQASVGMMKYYGGLLDKMHPRFFNHLDMYLKRNSAETTGHVNLTKDRMVLDIRSRVKDTFSLSSAEVYMHEVIHTMTAWALRQEAKTTSGIRIRLNKAMKVAKQHISEKDFLEVSEDVASERDFERAKAKMQYIFNSENAAEEFMAYALTNPRLIKLTRDIKISDDKSVKEPTSVFGYVIKTFTRLLNTVLGNFGLKDNDISVYDEVNKLAFALAEVNNKHVHSLENMNPVGKMMDALADGESILSEKLEKAKNSLADTGPIEVPGADASAYKKAKFYLSFIVKGFTNPVYRGYLGIWASSLRIRPEGSLREFMGGFFERSESYRIAEKFKLLSDSLESSRNSVINASSRGILESFKTPLTEEEDVALTRVLIDTNLGALMYRRKGAKQKSHKDMIGLLSSEEARYTAEGRVKYKIKELLKKDPERAKWTVAQGVTLGYYMATNNGNSSMNTNSGNIVRGFGLNQRFPKDEKLETLVSELASITAVKYTSSRDKMLVARLIKEEPKGVKLVTDTYEGYKRTSKELLFKNNQAHMFEGHTKELFDDSVDIKTAPLSEKAALLKDGYKYAYTVPAQKGVAQKTPMAVYTTGSWGKRERLRGSVALGRDHSKGTTLSNIKRMEDPELAKALFVRDFANVFNEGVKTHDEMRNGTYNVKETDNGMIPLYNHKGEVVDYRYTMSKENKEKLLLQDVRASQVLPRSMASLQYQLQTDELNSEILLAIKADMEEGWESGEIGKDGYTEYLLIGPDSADPLAAELYAMLPDTYREFILSRDDKTLAVRRDLSRIIFGGKHIKTSDAPGMHLLPGVVKNVVDTAEGLWIELIKISKGAILLKMPIVLAVNVATNVLFQITNGATDIPQLAVDYKDSIFEVNEYVKYKREAARLEQEIIADTAALARVKNPKALQAKLKEKTTELKRVENVLKNNPSHELFAAGLYQSHVEDLDNSAMRDTNKISRAVNQRLAKLPKGVRTVGEIAYVTQNTSWYKVSQEVLQRSDMIARSVENKQKKRVEQRMVEGNVRLPMWWLEDKGEDYEKKQVLTGKEREEFLQRAEVERIRILTDNYVNYVMPNGSFEEYLNRMGVFMFTKYIKRIQPVITNTSMSNPIKSTLLIGALMAGLDMALVQDSAFLAKAFDDNGDFSFTNVIPMYSPWYHIQNVFTPAIVKDELAGGLF
mgnify:CR=1 FL=1